MTDRANSLKRRLRAMSRSIFRREKIFVFERKLDDGCFEIEAKVEVGVRVAQRDDFPKFAKRFRKIKSKAKERFEMDHTCIIADFHGDFVNLTWVAFNEAYASELERKLQISPDSAYLYDGYTVPEYRGLGILPKVLGEAFSYLNEKGIRNVYACIRHNNFPSLRAVEKVGFQKMGTIIFTRIFKWRIYRCKAGTEEDQSKLKRIFSI